MTFVKYLLKPFHFIVYNEWMGENGGAIVNIVADNFNGMPMMS